MTTKGVERPGPMKVRVVLTITVDPDAYRLEYSTPSASRAEIREDVKRSFLDLASNEGGVYPPGIIVDVEGES